MNNKWKWFVITIILPAVGFTLSRAWDYWDRRSQAQAAEFRAINERLEKVEQSTSKWEVLTDHENRLRDMESKATFAYHVTTEFMKAVTGQRGPALVRPAPSVRGEPEEEVAPEDEPAPMAPNAPISPRALREKYEKE